jgi:hypothetical protein
MFSDARQHWKLASPDMRESLLKAGCTKDGLWDILTKAIKLKQARADDTSKQPDIDLTIDSDL